MPKKAFTVCNMPRCHKLTHSAVCDEHQEEYQRRLDDKLKARRKRHDEQRGTASERGYNHKWRKARDTYIARLPLCVICVSEGMPRRADVVDHVVPHKGDSSLFWDTDNWQSLCKRHHDIKTATEDGGFGRS